MLTSAATFTEKESAFRAVDRAFDQMKQHDLSSVACSSPAISPAATPKEGGVHKASTKLIRELMEHSGIIDSLSEGGDSDSDAGSVLSDLHRSIGRLSSLRKQCIDGPISHATASQRIPVEGHNIRSMALVARDSFLPLMAITHDLQYLRKAVNALNTATHWHVESLSVWFRGFSDRATKYITALESVIHPWVARRAAVAADYHANHSTIAKHLARVQTLLDELTYSPRSLSASTLTSNSGPPDTKLALVTATTTLSSQLLESLLDEQQTLATSMEAHFTEKEYTTSCQAKYWEVMTLTKAEDTTAPSSMLQPLTVRRSRGLSLFSSKSETTDVHSPEHAALRNRSATLSPLLPDTTATTPAFHDVDRLYAVLLPWLTQQYSNSPEDEALIVNSFPALHSPAHLERLRTFWRPNFELSVQGMVCSIFDNALEPPIRTAQVVKCGCL